MDNNVTRSFVWLIPALVWILHAVLVHGNWKRFVDIEQEIRNNLQELKHIINRNL